MLGKSLKTAAAGNAGERYFHALTGDTNGQAGYGITLDSDKNIYIAGGINQGGFLVKYNSIGVVQWVRKVGYQQTSLRDVVVDSTGNVYVCGYTRVGTPGGIEEMFVAKFNSSGAIQWQKRFKISDSYIGWSISVDNTNSVIWCSGYVTPVGAHTYQVVLKIAFDGTLSDGLGVNNLGGAGGWGRRACVDSAGNLIVTGKFYHGGGAGLWSAYLVRFYAGGSSHWYQLYGDSATSTASIIGGEDVCYDNHSQHLYAVGASNSGDTYLIKVSNNGNLIWQKNMTKGANFTSVVHNVISDHVGGIYVVGQTTKSGGGHEMFIAKFATNGNNVWFRTLGSTSNTSNEYAYAVYADDTGPYIAGMTNHTTSTGGEDIVLFHPPADGTMTGAYNGLVFSQPGYSASNLSSSMSNAQGIGVSPFQQALSGVTETTTNYTIYQPNLTNQLVYLS